jgi:hypothetical protein
VLGTSPSSIWLAFQFFVAYLVIRKIALIFSNHIPILLTVSADSKSRASYREVAPIAY